ncbi:MAG: hypothetical protein QCI38_06295 [Candidatus Thermoplasmatota archaeon]|nr:hypothetical protein [Candidatus Thermoplasmatota archaeon]
MRLPQLLWYDSGEEEEEDEEPNGFPCYEFNSSLPENLDDDYCVHCKKYLTLQCEHLELFLDEVEE